MPSTLVLKLQPPRADDAKLLSGVLANVTTKHNTNLRAVLREKWASDHKLVPDIAIGDEKQDTAISKCRKFGMCVCSGDGRLVYQLRNRLQAHAKMRFPQNSPSRKGTLKASYVVLRLQFSSASGADDDCVWRDRHLLHIGCFNHEMGF